jgi:uncharacterized protein
MAGSLMYLLDTNIFLEYILRRSRLEEVKDFFQRADLTTLTISDFSLHTIGVIYLREHKSKEFLTFVNEDIIASGIRVINVTPDYFSKITGAAERYHLDFDDAYQYAVAEQNRLSIVSFDKDFDRTENGRMEPKDLFP